jgi:hypothetical protein
VLVSVGYGTVFCNFISQLSHPHTLALRCLYFILFREDDLPEPVAMPDVPDVPAVPAVDEAAPPLRHYGTESPQFVSNCLMEYFYFYVIIFIYLYLFIVIIYIYIIFFILLIFIFIIVILFYFIGVCIFFLYKLFNTHLKLHSY